MSEMAFHEENENQSDELTPKATLDEVLSYLDRENIAVLLFVDQTALCSNYSAASWVPVEAKVIEVDPEILDHFQINKVPQWRFYVRGTEVHHVIGTIAHEDYLENKQEVFGKFRSI